MRCLDKNGEIFSQVSCEKKQQRLTQFIIDWTQCLFFQKEKKLQWEEGIILLIYAIKTAVYTKIHHLCLDAILLKCLNLTEEHKINYATRELLIDFYLDKRYTPLLSKELQDKIATTCLCHSKKNTPALISYSIKHRNDALWKKSDSSIMKSVLEERANSIPFFYEEMWIRYLDGKDSRNFYHELMAHANKSYDTAQQPTPITQQPPNPMVKIQLIMLIPQLIKSYYYPQIRFTLFCSTAKLLYETYLIENIKPAFIINKHPFRNSADEHSSETEQALVAFEKKYGYRHPDELIREDYLEGIESVGPLCTITGKILIPPSPNIDQLVVSHELAHAYHGDALMAPITQMIMLSLSFYQNKLVLAVPLLLIPITKSFEKRADYVAMQCLNTIEEKKAGITNMLRFIIKISPFKEEILSPPIISLHPYPKGIERIKRLCRIANISYKDFLEYFEEKERFMYNQWQKHLQPKPRTTIDKILYLPGHLLNLYGDTMTFLMSSFFQPIRPIIRSQRAIHASNIIGGKIHKGVLLSKKIYSKVTNYIEKEYARAESKITF